MKDRSDDPSHDERTLYHVAKSPRLEADYMGMDVGNFWIGSIRELFKQAFRGHNF